MISPNPLREADEGYRRVHYGQYVYIPCAHCGSSFLWDTAVMYVGPDYSGYVHSTPCDPALLAERQAYNARTGRVWS